MYLAVYTYDSKPELGFPKGYPEICRQYSTEEEARAAHPQAQIMSEEDYQSLHNTLKTQHPSNTLPPIKHPKRPNWFQRAVLRKKIIIPLI